GRPGAKILLTSHPGKNKNLYPSNTRSPVPAEAPTVKIFGKALSSMKILPNLIRGLGCVCFVCAAAMAFGCDQVPAGEILWVRLTAPITTYSAKPGDRLHAVLTEDLVCDNEIVLPMGTPIEGVVRSRHKV